MGRLRATFSKSEADKKIQFHVYEAQKNILSAMRVCEDLRRVRGVGSRRASTVLAVLDKSLRVLSNVIRITPRYDLSDPDLNVSSARRGVK